MQHQNAIVKKRIESIDILRGIVMVIMALDHVRDYFHVTANTADPLDLATTNPILYFTRWITHFCAPVFVFLSGTSIYLQSLRKTKKQLSSFLITRGLWLILIEVTFVTFAWTFNPAYNFIILQVIWAIGISMVIMGVLVYLPFWLILALGFIIVFGHNMLDIPEATKGFEPNFLMDLLHSGPFSSHKLFPNHYILIAYPFLAWTGLMMLGFCVGYFFTPKFTAAQRQKILTWLGLILLVLFVAIRYTNAYGNPELWTTQQTGFYTILSFIDVHKYPPSLLYMCVTIGPALIMLAILENVKNAFTEKFRIIGRVAFFYYVLHLYLIHLVSAIFYLASGHSWAAGTSIGKGRPFLLLAAEDGYPLWVVYVIWTAVILILYPLCRWYNSYKSAHPEKTWLSYL